MDDKLKELEERLKKLEDQINRYRGFIGGMIFVITSLWAFISLVADPLMRKFGMK